MIMSNPTPDEVRASIVPKSDQLNADDLLIGPITVTITKVRRGDKEQPIIVELEDRRPYKPCKTMRRILIAVFSDDPKTWSGQRMTLYCDPDVLWGGVKIGGIRISHLSGLEHPRTFMLTKSRGKRAEVTINPIVNTLSAEDAQTIKMAEENIAGATSLEEMAGIAETMKTMPDVVKETIRPVYAQRKKELEQG